MKGLLWNLIALLCAVAIFSGSVVYSASNIPTIAATEDAGASDNKLEEHFFQDDLGIADLLNPVSSDISSNESRQLSSQESSSLSSESSSAVISAPSSSSKPAVSSKTPSSSQALSSKPITSHTPSSSHESSSHHETSTPVNSKDEGNQNSIDEELLYIVSGAVQREIVGTNTTPAAKYYEAYKAQAVACRTYMEYHKRTSGSYPSMPFAEPHPKTIELVRSVWNQMIYYNGNVINAVYHAASGGETQSASYVWGGTVAYLKPRTSRYDDYISSFSISVSEAEQKLSAYDISVSGDPSAWFELHNASLTDGGFIDRIFICGTSVKGRTLRESIFGSSKLKSCKITAIDVSGDTITFHTKGYGHGVGMSQLGALGYAANEGYSYRQILQYYYTGVTIR